jgi:hypothetical protein
MPGGRPVRTFRNSRRFLLLVTAPTADQETLSDVDTALLLTRLLLTVLQNISRRTNDRRLEVQMEMIATMATSPFLSFYSEAY